MRLALASDASGVVAAVQNGLLAVVVDVIDFSTSMEAVLEAGALEVYGASPDGSCPPVTVSPADVGRLAGKRARLAGAPVVVVGEPRLAGEEMIRHSCRGLLVGLAEEGVKPEGFVPNMGAETPKLIDVRGAVVVGVSMSGGVAFDAALAAGGWATTATVARTAGARGEEPARRGLFRALDMVDRESLQGMTFIAASGNSLEDVLAARFCYQYGMKLLPEWQKSGTIKA